MTDCNPNDPFDLGVWDNPALPLPLPGTPPKANPYPSCLFLLFRTFCLLLVPGRGGGKPWLSQTPQSNGSFGFQSVTA